MNIQTLLTSALTALSCLAADNALAGGNDPVITSFTADQDTVSPGTTVTLTWNASNFDSLTLNGVLIEEPGNSIPVSPLVTTGYTLIAANAFGSTSAVVTVTVVDVPNFIGATGRFVEVVKNDTTNTRLHISEIEVFQFGINPDEADADGTSGNDLVQAGSPSTETPPTTTSLEHGTPATVYDGDLESGAAVWSTLNGLGVEPRYMLDLGATVTIDKIRIFGRADTCCTDRLQNVTINFYEDNGSGGPGALINSADFPGTAPQGNQGHIEVGMAIPDPGISNFTVDKPFIPQGDPITLTWVVNTETTSVTLDNGIGDVTSFTNAQGVGSYPVNPGPLVNTVYTLSATRPTGTSVSTLTVEVTDQPLIFDLSADSGLVSPGTTVTLSWDVANAVSLDLNGTDVTDTTGTTVMPNLSTTYTLTATNGNGSTSEEVRVQVVLPGEPIISEFMADNSNGLADEDGEPSDWIEICNPTAQTALLDGYYLTDDPLLLTKWRIPNVALAAGSYLVIFASGNDRALAGSELHTNFSLSKNGEYLALVKPDGLTIVNEFSPAYPSQHTDVSYGFDSVALAEGFFLSPTPGSANTGGFTGFVEDTSFSVDRGFYDAPISVAITTLTPGAEIRYTVNGAKPTATTGLVYTGPVNISQTTVLRAAAFKQGFVPTNVDTHTYIFTADVIAHPNMRTSITQDPVYGPQMVDSLKSIPSISLTFLGDVERTEKEVSMEMINFEDGHAQVDAGMVRFGSYVTNFAKRGIRVSFRSEYGPSKLKFPIFNGFDYDIPPAADVDGIDLRAGNHDMAARGAYMSNRFVDDAMIEMGQIAPHGRFVHVYLNGVYWGQYHLRERWNAAMLAEYFGGRKEDYEAINANNSGSNFLTGQVYDGTGQYWSETQSLVAGSNPFSMASGHMDMDNVFDFMLLWVSGNSESEFRSAGSPPLGVPFKFFMKDADGFLRSPGHPADHQGPLSVMSELRNEGDPDYKTLLADRIHKHFYNDGALTPAKNIARLQRRVDETQLSFLSEAARWDFRTPSSWQSYQNNLISSHFPSLTNTMIGRFQAANMYPNTAAPSFSQHGGKFSPGFQVTVTAPAGTIYYTLDGTDPRESADPVEVDPPLTLVPEGAAKSVHVPVTATDGFTDGGGKAWNEPGYDDSAWTVGTGGVGYEESNGYQNFFDIDVQSTLADQRTSCLIRIPFAPAVGSLTGMTAAELRVRYDDGYVAYLNGTEVARKNFTGTPDGDSQASSQHNDGSAVVLERVDISVHFGLLQEGQENVLAIHGLNVSTGSSDFLISCDLRVSEAPQGGGTGGAISETAVLYTGAIPLATTGKVRARVLNGSEWSAMNEALFVQDAGGLVVSEFMYNPSGPTAAEILAGFNDSEDFEYFELMNTTAGTMSLSGIHFTDGITFDFTGSAITSLAPGERVLIVEDLAAFAFRYGSGLPVAGQYVGKLKDEGELLRYADALDETVIEFTYDNIAPWPVEPDGQGPSMVLINPNSVPDHKLPASWQGSALNGGTPGTEEVSGLTFPQWAAANGVTGGMNGDDDKDGLSNIMEFLQGSSATDIADAPAPGVEIVNGFAELTFQLNLEAAGVLAVAEVSGDLEIWNSQGGFTQHVQTINNGDGTATVTWRSLVPVVGSAGEFLRVRFDVQ